MNKDIQTYNDSQTNSDKEICNLLAKIICDCLLQAENKIWHAHPVWFLDGNPIVGYSKLKNCIRLLFWSGQSFDEEVLQKEGSFKAAEMRYTAADQIDTKEVKRWLEKSKTIQWGYKNLIKRKGRLEPLKGIIIKTTSKQTLPYGSIKFKSIDEYHETFPEDIQIILQQLRQTIKKAAPQSVEVISYNMPAFKLHKVLVYYAVHKEHIGFYPTSSPIMFFKDELAKYNTSKGAIQLPINKPLPTTLIKKIVKFRVTEDIEKSMTKKRTAK
jgi:uncharacterized protein YdhG (YjbR/CyaY superfamily)